jgi:glutathione S-transferase
MAEFTFFTNPMSRGQIARWALHEAGADYETVLVDWQDKPAALLEANPLGKVPTIVHHTAAGDLAVSEAAAVCHYLAETHPDAELLPEGPEKAAYFRLLFFAAGPVEQAVTAKAMGWEVPQGRTAMAGFGTWDMTIGMLESEVGKGDFICGDRFTMADVYVGSQVDWGLSFGTMPERPAFVAYAERLRARDAYQASKAIDMALIAEAQG